MKAGCDTQVCKRHSGPRGRMLREIKVILNYKVSLTPVWVKWDLAQKKPKRTKYNTNHVSSRCGSTGVSLQRQLSRGLVARHNPGTERPRTAVHRR